jgi:hypothetical protein
LRVLFFADFETDGFRAQRRLHHVPAPSLAITAETSSRASESTSSPALTSGCSAATGSVGFFFSCSRFNRFAHGNRRLPRSTLSGVECLPSSRRRRRRDFDFPRYRTVTPLRTPEPLPHRAGFATLPGQQSAAGSAP